MTDILRLRKTLTGAERPAAPPAGLRFLPATERDPAALHALLAAAYTNGFGSVPTFAEWWPGIAGDEEYDPNLVFVLADSANRPAGMALCWNSGFVKDLAVAEAWRGRGLGEALLGAVFAAFAERGFRHVDLKVMAANAGALRLYRRAGMEEAPL